MQNNIFNERDNGFAFNTINRSSIIHHKSSSPTSDSISLPILIPANVRPKRRNVLQIKNYSKQLGTGRTAVADRKPKIIQWGVSNSSQASDSNTD